MFYQGEQIRIYGAIASSVCGPWKDLTDLSGFRIVILIRDADGRKELVYSNDSEEYPITIEDGAFYLTIPAKDTIDMLGEYIVDVAISTNDGEDNILVDNKGKLFVHRSKLGRQLQQK